MVVNKFRLITKKEDNRVINNEKAVDTCHNTIIIDIINNIINTIAENNTLYNTKNNDILLDTVLIDNHDDHDNYHNSNISNIDINLDEMKYEQTFDDEFKKSKYINELNSMFDLTKQLIENMNLKKKKQRELMHLNCLTKKSFIENIVEENNELCIKITEDIVNNSAEILKQIPKYIIDSLLSYDNQNSDVSDIPKKQFKINIENIFTHNDKIQIKGNYRVLILRNIFKNIHKLYFDFFDFINDNLDLFKQSVIIDKPVFDNYKYILYDKSNVHSNSLYDIYKSWDNSTYEQYKIINSEYNHNKLIHLQYLKNGHISNI